MRGGGSQEEELFLCCPELLATLFLVERMLAFEAVEIAGLRRYVHHNMAGSHIAGLSRSKQFCRPVPEAERRDSLTTVAMDAICFNAYGKASKHDQYQPTHVRREIRKCLVALRPPAAAGSGARRSFVTGLWGCGAFRGDPELKCVIQWICCSLDASVDKMIFCPFDQRESLSHAGLAELVELLPGRVSAKRVFDLLVEDQDYAWSSSTFRYLLKKLASAGA
jgi:poly(ADP-ribose) glycohydrolase